MKSLPSLFIARLFWAAVFGGVGVSLLSQGIEDHSFGIAISGVGMVLLGIGGFLHPIPFNSPITMPFVVARETAIGPRALRSATSALALACLLGGAILRYVFQS